MIVFIILLPQKNWSEPNTASSICKNVVNRLWRKISIILDTFENTCPSLLSQPAALHNPRLARTWFQFRLFFALFGLSYGWIECQFYSKNYNLHLDWPQSPRRLDSRSSRLFELSSASWMISWVNLWFRKMQIKERVWGDLPNLVPRSNEII